MNQGNNMNQTSRPVGLIAMALTALLATLVGCGGGGGSDEPAPPPALTYNVQAAFKNLPAASRSFPLAGTATNGSALTLLWTITPIGPSVFPLTNTASQRVDSSIDIRTATQSLPDFPRTQQSHFNASLDGLGSVRPDGSCSQSSNPAPPALPTAALLNASGSLGTATVYATCLSSASVINRIVGNWTLEQGAGFVYLCANTQLLDAAGALLSREYDCVEVSPDGTVGSHARLTVAIAGTVLVFSN